MGKVTDPAPGEVPFSKRNPFSNYFQPCQAGEAHSVCVCAGTQHSRGHPVTPGLHTKAGGLLTLGPTNALDEFKLKWLLEGGLQASARPLHLGQQHLHLCGFVTESLRGCGWKGPSTLPRALCVSMDGDPTTPPHPPCACDHLSQKIFPL